jgi:hypothetical protein
MVFIFHVVQQKPDVSVHLAFKHVLNALISVTRYCCVKYSMYMTHHRVQHTKAEKERFIQIKKCSLCMNDNIRHNTKPCNNYKIRG